MTIYAKEGNAGVKKVILSVSKIDPENQSNRFVIFMLFPNIFLVGALTHISNMFLVDVTTT